VRSVKEWIEPNHDKPIPDRVKDRVVRRANSLCKACGNRVRFGGQVDHIPAVVLLADDEPQRESNLQFLCKPCHTKKTGKDVAEKATSYRKRKKQGPLKREQSAWSKRYHEAKARGIDPWRRPKVTP
jgi:5-methylcytosine-specific restriction endonuclease McrA